jgi:hypothetical protein
MLKVEIIVKNEDSVKEKYNISDEVEVLALCI